MRKSRAFSVVVLLILSVVFLTACDTRKAAVERSKQKAMLTQEQANLQSQNTQKVREQINAYFKDFGAYPQSLDELKQASYDIPEEPLPGWQWQYRITQAGPELSATPK